MIDIGNISEGSYEKVPYLLITFVTNTTLESHDIARMFKITFNSEISDTMRYNTEN